MYVCVEQQYKFKKWWLLEAQHPKCDGLRACQNVCVNARMCVVLFTLAVVDMAPAIFIWEFMTLVCVDMEVTFELTA